MGQLTYTCSWTFITNRYAIKPWHGCHLLFKLSFQSFQTREVWINQLKYYQIQNTPSELITFIVWYKIHFFRQAAVSAAKKCKWAKTLITIRRFWRFINVLCPLGRHYIIVAHLTYFIFIWYIHIIPKDHKRWNVEVDNTNANSRRLSSFLRRYHKHSM